VDVATKRREVLGPCDGEVAFYDALSEIESAKKAMGTTSLTALPSVVQLGQRERRFVFGMGRRTTTDRFKFSHDTIRRDVIC
jgi:hypothetical protein